MAKRLSDYELAKSKGLIKDYKIDNQVAVNQTAQNSIQADNLPTENVIDEIRQLSGRSKVNLTHKKEILGKTIDDRFLPMDFSLVSSNEVINFDTLREAAKPSFVFSDTSTYELAYKAFKSVNPSVKIKEVALKNRDGEGSLGYAAKQTAKREQSLIDVFNNSGIFDQKYDRQDFLDKMSAITNAQIKSTKINPMLVKDIMIVIYKAEIMAEYSKYKPDQVPKKLANVKKRLDEIIKFGQEQDLVDLSSKYTEIFHSTKGGFDKTKVSQQYINVMNKKLNDAKKYFSDFFKDLSDLASEVNIVFNYGYGDFINFNYGDIGEVFSSLIMFKALGSLFGDKVTISGGMAGNTWKGFKLKSEMTDKEINELIKTFEKRDNFISGSIQKVPRLGVEGSSVRTIDLEYTIKYKGEDEALKKLSGLKIPFDAKLSVTEGSRQGKYIGEYNTNIANLSKTDLFKNDEVKELFDIAIMLMSSAYVSYNGYPGSEKMKEALLMLTLAVVSSKEFLDHFIDMSNIEDLSKTDQMPYFLILNNNLYWFSSLLQSFNNYYFNSLSNTSSLGKFAKVEITKHPTIATSRDEFSNLIHTQYLDTDPSNYQKSIINKIQDLRTNSKLSPLYRSAIEAMSSTSLKLAFAISVNKELVKIK